MMKKQNRYITPEGTRDILFEEERIKDRVAGAFSELARSKGYRKIETPALEFYDVFEPFIAEEQMIKISDYKGRLMVLRPDVTQAVARVMATRLKDEALPVRLFYQQDVFRGDVRTGQISQSGIELIGVGGVKADIELIVTAATALEKCGLKGFCIEISDIGFFRGLMDALDLEPQQKEDIRAAIESKNYAALGDILDALDLPDCQKKALSELPRLFGTDEVFEKAALIAYNDRAADALDYLKEIYARLQKLGYADIVSIDLGLVNRGDYYTGLIVRGYIEGYGEAVLFGGRYDDLCGAFGRELAATGFALYLDKIVKAEMGRAGKFAFDKPDGIIFYEDGYEKRAIFFAKENARLGKCFEMSLFDNIEQTRQYCMDKGIGQIFVIGDEVTLIKL